MTQLISGKCDCLCLFHLSALTEKIVSVLPRMKCPHRLEPHQIQGLDFIHIFPVVQVCTLAYLWHLKVQYLWLHLLDTVKSVLL